MDRPVLRLSLALQSVCPCGMRQPLGSGPRVWPPPLPMKQPMHRSPALPMKQPRRRHLSRTRRRGRRAARYLRMQLAAGVLCWDPSAHATRAALISAALGFAAHYGAGEVQLQRALRRLPAQQRLLGAIGGPRESPCEEEEAGNQTQKEKTDKVNTQSADPWAKPSRHMIGVVFAKAVEGGGEEGGTGARRKRKKRGRMDGGVMGKGHL